MRKAGVEVLGHANAHLEGGDVVVCACARIAFLGYGFRSSVDAASEVEDFLGLPVTPLELVDPYFYHLDTALNLTCHKGQCIAFAAREAFSNDSWERLLRHPSIHQVVEVPREEAIQFGLNWVEVRENIILGRRVPKIMAALESLGKKVHVRPLSQFQLAGGSAACLVACVHDLN